MQYTTDVFIVNDATDLSFLLVICHFNHQHWVRQEVQENRLQLEWVPISEMPADGLTKVSFPDKNMKNSSISFD